MTRRLSWLPLALLACVPMLAHAARAADPARTLGRYHWQLSTATGHDGHRLDALFAHPDKPLQLDFADGRVSVRNACNGMGGSYRIEDGRLVVGPMMHTMMACADPALNRLDGMIGQRLASHPAIAPEWRLFAITGFLGGLTTFSTFSAEVVTLIQQGRFSWAAAAIATHVIGALLMTLLGIATVALTRGA